MGNCWIFQHDPNVSNEANMGDVEIHQIGENTKQQNWQKTHTPKRDPLDNVLSMSGRNSPMHSNINSIENSQDFRDPSSGKERAKVLSKTSLMSLPLRPAFDDSLIFNVFRIV